MLSRYLPIFTNLLKIFTACYFCLSVITYSTIRDLLTESLISTFPKLESLGILPSLVAIALNFFIIMPNFIFIVGTIIVWHIDEVTKEEQRKSYMIHGLVQGMKETINNEGQNRKS